ncbi:MAG: class I SAM-dependent methyltransferase [Burkholderiales bacterium]
MKTSGVKKSLSPNWGRYVLDNAAPRTATRFSALAALYDETTIRHLEHTGVQNGWHCWEIGAGPGSIAQWLCDRVGMTGSVLATDIDTCFLSDIKRPNLQVRRHDIVSDPLPEERFDLIHTRLVLLHVPERELVMDRMVSALKPGGWMVAEEFDSLSHPAAPERFSREVALKSAAALLKVMMERGVEPGFGRALAALFRARGMQSIAAEGRILMTMGRTVGSELMNANFTQLRGATLATGLVTEGEFAQDLARLDVEEFLTPSSVMWTVAARRPPSAPEDK